MNLSHLRYFVELAHTRHYTRAAEHLFITQPSLSHAIGQLESELGVPLFERSGRNTTLTRLGEEFLVCAERTLSTLDSGVESLRRSAQGEGLIRLGLVRPLGVDFIPDLAARFDSCFSFQGKFFHFLAINRHREVEHNLSYPASVFPFLREHLNSLDKGFHKLFLFRFCCGMVDFIKCQ